MNEQKKLKLRKENNMMKNKCKRRAAAIVMCVCLLVGLMPTTVFAAEKSVSLPVYTIDSEADENYVLRDVTATLSSDTAITLGPTQDQYNQYGVKFDYYNPMQDSEMYGTPEDGYDKLVECFIFFQFQSDDFSGESLVGNITFPLPSGYDGTTAKFVGGATAIDSTATTVTFPVTLAVYENSGYYIAEGYYMVEYKEKQQHQHSYGDWQKDATNHWHECDCGDIADSAAHSYDNDADTTCNVCGYVRTVQHQHSYGGWQKDATNHWRECTDEGCSVKADKAAHTWNGGAVTTPATETTAGVKTYTCSVCLATKTEVIPATGKTDDGKTDDVNTDDGKNDDKTDDVNTDVGKNDDKTDDVNTDVGKTDEPKALSVGTKVKDAKSKAVYKVTNADAKTPEVAYTAPTSKTVKTVTIPDTISVDGVTYKVTSIGSKAFYKCTSLKSVVIPSKVEKIGSKAFYGCTKLTTVTIGSGVTTIGDSAFYGCTKLSKVTMGKKVKTIGSNAFYKCKSLKSIVLPSKVEKIGSKAFYGCTNLTTVTIGSGVTTIGDSAFYGCTKLSKVTMGKKVKTIGNNAFYKCTALKSIILPSKVEKIGSKAFYGCKKLTKITIQTTKLTDKKVGSSAFKGIYSKAKIKVPKAKLKSYKTLLKKNGIGSKVKVY